LAAAPQGDITGLTAGSGIAITSATGPVPTVAVDYTATGVIADATDGTGVTLVDADDFIFQDDGGGGVKYANLSQLKTYIGPGTYSWTLAGTSGSSSTIANSGTATIIAGTAISTTGNGSGGVTVAYTGGTGSMSSWTLSDGSNTQSIVDGNTVTVTAPAQDAAAAGITPVVSATDTLTLNLDQSKVLSVTSAGDTDYILISDASNDANERIPIRNIDLNQWGTATGTIDMGSNKILALANGTGSNDAVNLGQVQSLIAGVGLFQGGYNATTGQTVNLSSNGSLDGASNIALDKGDFFVVTVAGGAFYTETLEVGDMIYANQDITASSDPAITVYTVVIADENIAAAGATDGATAKGVAGFDSGNFGVTASGWVTLDDVATAGSKGGATKSLSATITAKGLVTSLTEQAIAITASQVTDFCTAVETCVDSNLTYSTNIGDNSATSYTVTHGLGLDVIVQLYDNSSFDTVYADVVRNNTSGGQVVISTNSPIATNDVRVLVSKCA